MACCMPGGYLTPDKARLLEYLRAQGVTTPDRVQVWNDGPGWKLMTYGGQPTTPPCRGRRDPRATVAEPRGFILGNDGVTFW